MRKGKKIAGQGGHDIVVMGSSAGGLEALSIVLSGLPSKFSAAVFIVQHVSPDRKSLLAEILARRSKLPLKLAVHGEMFVKGVVYIAPSDHHLLVNPDSTISLTQTELVHFVRPSADLLFESAALAFKERVVAVVLTGTGVDGAKGVETVKSQGGTVIAQDEQTSDFFGMPSAAIRTQSVDFVVALQDIALLLTKLVEREGAKA